MAGIVDEIALASREQASGLAQLEPGGQPPRWRNPAKRGAGGAILGRSCRLQQQAHHLAEVADTFRLEEQVGLRRPDLTALR